MVGKQKGAVGLGLWESWVRLGAGRPFSSFGEVCGVWLFCRALVGRGLALLERALVRKAVGLVQEALLGRS